MITKSKQDWTVGQTVKVGFLANLQVVAVIATPGDFAPDAYILSRNEQFYSFVPHNGLSKIDEYEVRQLIAKSKARAEKLAAAAIEKASKSAAHAALISEFASA